MSRKAETISIRFSNEVEEDINITMDMFPPKDIKE
jgi:hypothetical protein